jgi:topoisomerase IA-like protein
MIEFINRMTGTRMRVADDRVQEYLAAGHKPVAVPEEEKPEEVTEEKPVRKRKKR